MCHIIRSWNNIPFCYILLRYNMLSLDFLCEKLNDFFFVSLLRWIQAMLSLPHLFQKTLPWPHAGRRKLMMMLPSSKIWKTTSMSSFMPPWMNIRPALRRQFRRYAAPVPCNWVFSIQNGHFPIWFSAVAIYISCWKLLFCMFCADVWDVKGCCRAISRRGKGSWSWKCSASSDQCLAVESCNGVVICSSVLSATLKCQQ